MFNNLYNLSVWFDETSTSSAEKYSARPCTDVPSPSAPTSVTANTVIQCQIVDYTTTLKMVEDRGYPWVTLHQPLKYEP